MKGKRLTKSEIEAIKSKARSGWSNKEIAEHFGIGHNTVWRHTKDVTGRRKKKTYATEGMLMQIIDLRDKGWTFKRIATQTGLSETAVHSYWHKLNDMEDIHLIKQDIKDTNECLTNTGGDTAYCQPKYAIHWVGNELAVKKMDIKAFEDYRKRVTGKPPVITPPMAENDVPIIHPDKVETTNATLWLVITTVAFVLGLAVAGL